MDSKETAVKERVINANRRFYNAVALDYEKIDGRRTQPMKKWLRANLENIQKKCNGSRLLDLGTGTGFLTDAAKGLFSLRVGVDVSPEILEAHKDSFDLGVVADAEHLPFPDNSFDVVTSFSVLHHLYDFEPLVEEVSRVLATGGVFYSDHDMDERFNKIFHIPLSMYRLFHNAKRRYTRANKNITSELYDTAEWHKNGIDSQYIAGLFRKRGFNVESCFHWYGLSPVSDFLFSKRCYRRGMAPIFSIIAVKQI